MGTINISIGHDDNLVIAQLGDIKFVGDCGKIYIALDTQKSESVVP